MSQQTTLFQMSGNVVLGQKTTAPAQVADLIAGSENKSMGSMAFLHEQPTKSITRYDVSVSLGGRKSWINFGEGKGGTTLYAGRKELIAATKIPKTATNGKTVKTRNTAKKLTLFPKLSPELRNRVWQFAMPGHRLIEVRLPGPVYKNTY